VSIDLTCSTGIISVIVSLVNTKSGGLLDVNNNGAFSTDMSNNYLNQLFLIV